jgi:hypothetical protein
MLAAALRLNMTGLKLLKAFVFSLFLLFLSSLVQCLNSALKRKPNILKMLHFATVKTVNMSQK